ncbi:MAG: hypothetical protein IKQ49_09635 [Eubacterium sp.]|nr:hypothetical protein [Eubacterium sp.]
MKKKRIAALFLAGGMLLSFFSLLPADGSLAAGADRNILYWTQRISEDQREGEFFTRILGMRNVTRQSVIRTIRENWTEGLKYAESNYSLTHTKADTCINYGDAQYSGRVKTGYGYNCTGFAASVLYYANGGSKENALSEMNSLYLPLKQGRSYRSQTAFTDATGWYYFFAGEQYTSQGKGTAEKTKIYYMGNTTGADSIQEALQKAAGEGKLKKGYLIFFWPSTGYDCHVGFYAGKSRETGLHMMYHAAGKGIHSGIRIREHITLSQVTSEGASYLYIIPLPEEDERDTIWLDEGRNILLEMFRLIKKDPE